jgi:Uma2 family endonuclease
MRSKLTTIGGLYLPGRPRWTRESFQKVADSGAFPPETRLELIEGEIVVREEPMRPTHASAVRRAEKECQRLFGAGFDVRCQLPLALGGRNEPLPDVAVVAGDAEDFDEEHPTTAVLVIEVSDTTLRYDRLTKASLYARAGIPEYWILNLLDRTLEVHKDPRVDRTQPLHYGYTMIEVLQEGESVVVLSSGGASIAVSDLLPYAPNSRTN